MKKILFSSFFVTALSCGTFSQLTVQLQTPQQFVNQLLGNGIVASNVSYSGGMEQIGSFNGQNCNIGLGSGLVLSTGDIAVGLGPNDDGGYAIGGGYWGATDPDLDIIDPFSTHNDAAILEFDFIATGDSISFRYVFASEEYPEYVGWINDIFGFFLSGPGINGPFTNSAVNVAMLPSNQEVSINTVNNGNDGINGPCMNCQYYVYNGDGGTAPYSNSNYYVQFDGFTKVLTAKAPVQCGETYHIKIVIADASDIYWDSSVFLEAGSFSSNAVAIEGTPNIILSSLPDDTLLENFIDGYFTISRPDASTESVIDLIISGTATEGVDYSDLPAQVVIPAGQLSVNIPVEAFGDGITEGTEAITVEYYYINSCGEQDTASTTLFIADYIAMELEIEDIYVCAGSTEQVSAIPSGGTPNYSYTWSSGQSSSSATFSQGSAGSYSVTVADHWGETVTADFIVVEPEPFIAADSLDLCTGENSGQLASGGALPYSYEYDSSSLQLDNNGGVSTEIPGSYNIYITDGCGLNKEVLVNVKVCETIIPNIFTPNGDDENQTFDIDGLKYFPGSEMYIYNRWGTLVYESSSYDGLWDGKDLEEGVYFYVFKRSDGKTFDGYVNLNR
ncbi:MAG: choice-of-anchor L domain-containing protein [Crocinitomicaceae bacterium]|nr:choice-of-anchor L domain-containing protein [Crocinitomicaceae bacterium]